MGLHPDRGYDAVIEEARRADEQGFDSVWLSDHIMATSGAHKPDGPLDLFVLMTAIAAVTQRARLAWASLNATLRPPLLFAKMLTTLDVISHGRVICSLGSGWNKDEWSAYNLPLIEDHDQRAEYCREFIQVFKLLCSHPAPELTSFQSKFIQVRDLPFNPVPAQKPYPPIWIGGESAATMQTAMQHCDGWMTLSAGGSPERLREALSHPDWPKDRPMDVVRGGRIVVRRTREEALKAAQAEYDAAKAATPQLVPPDFEGFLAREIVGTPDECLQRIAEIESWGVTYLRAMIPTPDSQDAIAELLLPRLTEAKQPAQSR
jgi:alkanesulfonate monooxygenase SsuD/methylene tetrahydromethanopterin reductase-like flavin-dependent oxidoreductase (luciferase family)